MGDRTNIDWTDATWNPLRGCSRVSEGCRNCYAESVAHRFSGTGLPYEGLTRKGKWTGDIMLVTDHLADPLRWTRPRRVFVNSMSDLFHPNVPDQYIAAVFGVMAASPRHTFQVLTKRPERMLDWISPGGWLGSRCQLEDGIQPRNVLGHYARKYLGDERWRVKGARTMDPVGLRFPLPNVWLGVSVEDQATADERIPLLLQCPAAVRFVSAEPLLLGLDLSPWLREAWVPSTDAVDVGCDGEMSPWPLDWVIVGGESGPGARPCYVEHVADVVRQCKAMGVACFVKQLGAKPREPARWGTFPLELTHPKGGDMSEWPEDLRVREWPDGR